MRAANKSKKTDRSEISESIISPSKDSSDISDVADSDSVPDAFSEYDKKKASNNKLESIDNSVSKDSKTGNSAIPSIATNGNNYDDIDEMDEEAREEYMRTTVSEYVIKYLKVDSMMKKKQDEHKQEIKPIKDAKDKLENFLIGYLDKINEEYFQIGNKNTLVKTKTETKAAIKLDHIANSLFDDFKKLGLYEDEEETKKVVQELITNIDSKREVKVKKRLKKMVIKENKGQGATRGRKKKEENK